MRRTVCIILTLLLCLPMMIGIGNTNIKTNDNTNIYMADSEKASNLSAVSSEQLYGDADRNGEITSLDALITLQYSIGVYDKELSEEYLDVDGDATVSSNDALYILKYSCGIIDIFPVQLIKQEQTGNSRNGGIACEYGNYIYYTDLSTGLFRCNRDGSNVQMLITGSMDSIAVSGGYIYFIDYLKGAAICRTDLMGNGYEIIVDSASANLIVSDKILYYINISDGGSVFSCNTLNGQISRLAQGQCSMLNLYNGDLYYIKHSVSPEYGSITKLNPDTMKMTNLGQNTGFIDVCDGMIYYLNKDNSNRIYRMSVDGTGIVRFCNYGATRINVSSDKLYFVRPEDNYNIYELNCDKSYIGRVARVQSDYICIAGDFIYYTDDDMKVCRVDKNGRNIIKITQQ